MVNSVASAFLSLLLATLPGVESFRMHWYGALRLILRLILTTYKGFDHWT